MPFMEGLTKNRYVGRTFIQPTQKQRLNAVRLKLNPVESVITEEEIRQYIGADSLHYISLEGLKRSLDCMDPEGMCYACFNAQYPDNAEETLRQGSKYIFENEG